MTVSAIEFSRLGPPKLHLYGMRCQNPECRTLHPWWERYTCEVCKWRELVEEPLAGTGELTNYTVVYYPPRDFLGQEPYVVGHITMDEGVLLPAPVVDVAPEAVAGGHPGQGHAAAHEAGPRGGHLLLVQVRGRPGRRPRPGRLEFSIYRSAPRAAGLTSSSSRRPRAAPAR